MLPSALAPAATAPAMDLIFIEGLRGETVIGIHDSELHLPQPLVIDLVAGVPRALACSTDRIVDTIDYGLLRERVLRLLDEHDVQLLEAFAERIADIALGEFGAHWVRVRVAKPRKFDDVDAVGVLIDRHTPPREDGAAVHRAGAQVLQLIGAGMVPGGR